MPMDYAGMGEMDDEDDDMYGGDDMDEMGDDDDMYGDDEDDMEEMGGDMEYADDEHGDYEENIMGYSESRRGNVFEKMKGGTLVKIARREHYRPE